jgi:hypothetical protein
VRKADEFALAIRRKLILEVAAARPQAQITPVSNGVPVDCMVGEKMREEYADPYYPGLDR